MSETFARTDTTPSELATLLRKRELQLPVLTKHLAKIWEDVECFDRKEEHRGSLCVALATLQLAQEVQALRLLIEERFDDMLDPRPTRKKAAAKKRAPRKTTRKVEKRIGPVRGDKRNG